MADKRKSPKSLVGLVRRTALAYSCAASLSALAVPVARADMPLGYSIGAALTAGAGVDALALHANGALWAMNEAADRASLYGSIALNSLGNPPLVPNVEGAAFSRDGRTAWVISSSRNYVAVVDLATYSVATKKITVGSEPVAIRISLDGKTLYTANSGAASVSVIDAKSGKVTATIRVGQMPYDIALSPNGKTLYAANYLDGTISVIDTAKRAVTATVAVGKGPYSVAPLANGKAVYVANERSGTVSVINPLKNTLTDTISVGAAPQRLAAAPNNLRVYVPNSAGRSISVIDTLTNKVSVTVDLDEQPAAVLVMPNNRTVWIANREARSIVPLTVP